MHITIVVATDRHGLIGAGGGLPWHLPADLRRFRALTMGHPVVMGRRTWESIGRPLPGRHNIVVTTTRGYVAAGATVVSCLDGALAAAGDADTIMIIGGARLYAQALPRADRIHLTEVQATLAGDTWLPAFDRGAWREVAREAHPADARNPLPYCFITFERIRAG